MLDVEVVADIDIDTADRVEQDLAFVEVVVVDVVVVADVDAVGPGNDDDEEGLDSGDNDIVID